ncbi:MAG TPA: N-acetyltransferase [Clostridiales bacterium]|jgi:predicted GNAT family acetyltransferase|nr:N-acetyltransferase [Clostridiales bacterium]
MNFSFENNKIIGRADDGTLLAQADLVLKEDGLVEITHIFANPEMRGQGLAGEMMKEVTKYLREHKLKALATCSYAHAWLDRKRDEYEDVIAEGHDQINQACSIDGLR